MRTELIWLASFPRSGNTLLRHVIEDTTGIRTFTVYKNESSARSGLQNSDNSELTVEHFTCQGGVLFAKTHEPFHADTPARAIYVVRDGRDALVSFAHYLIDMEGLTAEFSSLLSALIESTDYYGGWSQHIQRWTERKAPVAVVHYSDLCHSPHAVLRKALDHLELSSIRVDEEIVVKTFQSLQAVCPSFYRRGGVGYWKEEMTENQQKLFMKLHGKALAKCIPQSS